MSGASRPLCETPVRFPNDDRKNQEPQNIQHGSSGRDFFERRLGTSIPRRRQRCALVFQAHLWLEGATPWNKSNKSQQWPYLVVPRLVNLPKPQSISDPSILPEQGGRIYHGLWGQVLSLDWVACEIWIGTFLRLMRWGHCWHSQIYFRFLCCAYLRETSLKWCFFFSTGGKLSVRRVYELRVSSLQSNPSNHCESVAHQTCKMLSLRNWDRQSPSILSRTTFFYIRCEIWCLIFVVDLLADQIWGAIVLGENKHDKIHAEWIDNQPSIEYLMSSQLVLPRNLQLVQSTIAEPVWSTSMIPSKFYNRTIVVSEMITELIRFEPEICICNGN